MQKGEYSNIYKNENSHFVYVTTHELVLNYLKIPTKSKKLSILDAGCGTGGLMVKLLKFGSVYGIDNSEEALRLAKRRNLENLKLGSIDKTRYKSDYFDVIVCIDVLYHKNVNEDKSLSELYRILKPKGFLILKVPAHDWLRGQHDKTVMTKHRYEKEELKQKLKKKNFKILKISYINSLFFLLAVIKRLAEKFLPFPISSDVYKVNPSLNGLFTKLGKAENKIIEKSGVPFGLSIFAVASKPNRGNSKMTRHF